MGFFSYNFSLSNEQLSRRIIEKLINFFSETEEKSAARPVRAGALGLEN